MLPHTADLNTNFILRNPNLSSTLAMENNDADTSEAPRVAHPLSLCTE